MMVPVRCFTCGKPIAHLWEGFKQRIEKGEPAEKVLTELGLHRYCCRRMLLSHYDFIDEIIKYKT